MKPKNLLQRVIDFAFSELERRARPSDETSPDPRPDEDAKDDGAASVSARDALQPEPAESATRERPEPAPSTEQAAAPSTEKAATPSAAEQHEPAPSAHHVHGLEAVRSHHGEGLTLRWSLTANDVARARTLLSGKSVLCLRVVRFSTARDDVLREVQDRPGVELEGECELADAPDRAVVSLGLRSGERFVSISHHVL